MIKRKVCQVLAGKLASDGGFSFPIYPHKDGFEDRIANTGFIVSLKGFEWRVDTSGLCQDQIAELIRFYGRTNHATLWAPHRLLGAWLDDGKLYLDVSEWFRDEHAALEACERRGQLAYFDCNRKCTVYNPKLAGTK